MTTETTDHDTATGACSFTWDGPATTGPTPEPSPAWDDPGTKEIHLLAAGRSPADVAAQIGTTPEAVMAKLNDIEFLARLHAVDAMQGLWAIKHQRDRLLPAKVRQLCEEVGAAHANRYRARALEYLAMREQEYEMQQEMAWAVQEALSAEKEGPSASDSP